MNYRFARQLLSVKGYLLIVLIYFTWSTFGHGMH
jgi:hypothetical protein